MQPVTCRQHVGANLGSARFELLPDAYCILRNATWVMFACKDQNSFSRQLRIGRLRCGREWPDKDRAGYKVWPLQEDRGCHDRSVRKTQQNRRSAQQHPLQGCPYKIACSFSLLQQIVVIERPVRIASEERKARLPINCASKR